MEICFGPTDSFVPCPDILRRLKLDGDLRAFERFETRGGGLDDLHGRVGARRSVQSQLLKCELLTFRSHFDHPVVESVLPADEDGPSAQSDETKPNQGEHEPLAESPRTIRIHG